MTGRVDKGIFITIEKFTPKAKKEVIRDNAPSAELVDADSMLDLFEVNELGLKPV